MSSSNEQRRAYALASHRREERVFPELPATHPLSIRRREVQRFRNGDGTHGRRSWNPSTTDELHPFPQRALNNTTTCYNGVDVVSTHFPETVRGTAFLKMQETVQPLVWTRNRDRACASTKRHTYRCEALERQEAPLSYLSTIIREDNRPEKKRLEVGWCASTTLEGFRGNRHITPAAEDMSHAEAHRKLNNTLTASLSGGYVTPYSRVKQLSVSLKRQRKLKEAAAAESLVDFYASQPGPAAFKLSNADEWWDMDPVAVTRDMQSLADSMRANPFSTTFRRTLYATYSSKPPTIRAAASATEAITQTRKDICIGFISADCGVADESTYGASRLPLSGLSRLVQTPTTARSMNRRTLNALELEQTAQKTRRLLLRCSPSSVNGIRSFSRSLGIADDLDGPQVTAEVFRRALQENNVALKEHEIENIFTVLDRNRKGTIDPTDFIAILCKIPSPLRQVWLQRVWRIFQKDPSSGSVDLHELHRLFRAEGHPAVVRSETTAAEVRRDFDATFNEATNPDGRVSGQEFAQYYSGVSASCSDDESFVALLCGVWPIPGVSCAFSSSLAKGEAQYRTSYRTVQSLEEKTAVANREAAQSALMRMIRGEHAPVVLSSGVTVRALSLSLAQADEAGTGFVSEAAFLNALRQQRLYVQNTSLLECLDTNGDGSVDIKYYEALLIPSPSAARLMLLERLWVHCFETKDTVYRVPVQELHRKYHSSSPADKDAFLTAWDVRTAREGKVEFEELVQWYVPQSAMVESDRCFEALLHQQWGKYSE